MTSHDHVIPIEQGGAVNVRANANIQRMALGTLATHEVSMTTAEVRQLIQVLADEYASMTGRRPFAKHGALRHDEAVVPTS